MSEIETDAETGTETVEPETVEPETVEPETETVESETLETETAETQTETIVTETETVVAETETVAAETETVAAETIESDPSPELPPIKEKRKFPWRWLGAAVSAVAIGTGCTFAVLIPQRTHLPGLATASDGRYTFAPLTLPTLAPGQAAPSSTANAGEQHISDIRKLLLSPPTGAIADTPRWVSRAVTLQLLDNPQADETLQTDGWRHTAAVSWQTPDGAKTQIWLLQFIDSDAASDGFGAGGTFAGQSLNVNPATITVNPYTSVSYVRTVSGATATWYGMAEVHDVVFLIEYKAPASIGLAPFEQEADLQAELLQ